jgi:hypothetical protein
MSRVLWVQCAPSGYILFVDLTMGCFVANKSQRAWRDFQIYLRIFVAKVVPKYF